MLYTACMKRFCTAFALLIWLLPVFGQGLDDVRERLQGMEWSMVAADWDTECKATAEALATLALDGDEMMFLRGRALEVLAAINSDIADSVFTTLIQQDREVVLRRRAVDSLCHSQSSLSLESVLVPLMAADDRHLRVRAANCLVSHGADSERVRLALQGYKRTAEAWELRETGLTRNAQ